MQETEYTIYSRCGCPVNHRAARALARCIWRKALYIRGAWRFASVSTCLESRPGKYSKIQLFETPEEAERHHTGINSSGCSGNCHGPGKHRLVELATELLGLIPV